MIEQREELILYTTAVCNLNCKYCFIDKNPSLKTIDQYLDESFMQTPDYYFEFAKEMILKDKLKKMQFWGGEPFLAMHRAYYTVEKCIEYYPNLSSFMASTNFVSDVFFEEFYGFLKVLAKFPEKQFNYSLQLSLDGIKEINDVNRGEGVTDKFVINFERFIKELQNELPNNVSIHAHLKPTLDGNSIRKLQTEEKVKEQFLFFETFMDTFNAYNRRNNLHFNLPIPNTACPSPHTQEEGILFANYCRLTRLLEKKNKETKIFKYYKKITSFENNRKIDYSNSCLNGHCGGHCGNGRTVVGLLPNRMVSCCHNGFVDLISDYKKNVLHNSNHMDTVTIEKSLFKNERNTLIFEQHSKGFLDYQKHLETFYQNDTTKVTNVASLIKLLADYGQIDKKYQDKKEAIQGAYFILSSTSYCVRDNLGTTGSIYMYPIGIIKLLLNGAREYIELKENN